MCYSIELSVSLAVAGCAVGLLLDGRPRLRELFLFYSAMEALQAVGYLVADACGGWANLLATAAAHVLVVVQPYLWNRHRALSDTDPRRRRLFGFAARLSLVWAFLYSCRLLPFWGALPSDVDPEIMSGAAFCTSRGPAHIQWLLPYRRWNGLEPNLFAYLLLWLGPVPYETREPWFKLAIWIAQIGFVSVTSASIHELPSTWCALSVPMLSLMLVRDAVCISAT